MKSIIDKLEREKDIFGKGFQKFLCKETSTGDNEETILVFLPNGMQLSLIMT